MSPSGSQTNGQASGPIDKKVGFVGAGNMAEAFIGALTKARIFAPPSIYASDILSDRLDFLKTAYGITPVEDNFGLFTGCDIVVLSVKPQHMEEVLTDITTKPGYAVANRKLVISIAAGMPIRKIEGALYSPLKQEQIERLPIIRVMPNTPAFVLAGMSGMSANRVATDEDKRVTRTVLEAVGKVIEFEEKDLDAVTALSGSGPAYAFYLIESMTAGGIGVGLDPEDAATLAVNTVRGAVKLLIERGESPESLRKKVTSPGGTTEAALEILESNRVKQIIIDAIAAATRRSIALSR